MLQRTFSWSDQPLRNETVVAIAVFSKGLHIGLLYRGGQDNNDLHVIHLLPVRDLKNEKPAGEWILWVDLNLPTPIALNAAAWCRLVWNRHRDKGLPYGFSFPVEFFDDSNEFTGAGEGLTCSSLVLAILEKVKVQILDYHSWSTRQEDEEWQTQMLDWLRENGADDEHLKTLERQIGNLRFRPLEVAGSANSDVLPVVFEDAVAYANVLDKLVRETDAQTRLSRP